MARPAAAAPTINDSIGSARFIPTIDFVIAMAVRHASAASEESNEIIDAFFIQYSLPQSFLPIVSFKKEKRLFAMSTILAGTEKAIARGVAIMPNPK